MEDRDHDGSFETSRIFADGLNIPIGLLPYGDGVLCFSIRRAKDADARADQLLQAMPGLVLARFPLLA